MSIIQLLKGKRLLILTKIRLFMINGWKKYSSKSIAKISQFLSKTTQFWSKGSSFLKKFDYFIMQLSYTKYSYYRKSSFWHRKSLKIYFLELLPFFLRLLSRSLPLSILWSRSISLPISIVISQRFIHFRTSWIQSSWIHRFSIYFNIFLSKMSISSIAISRLCSSLWIVTASSWCNYWFVR